MLGYLNDSFLPVYMQTEHNVSFSLSQGLSGLILEQCKHGTNKPLPLEGLSLCNVKVPLDFTEFFFFFRNGYF